MGWAICQGNRCKDWCRYAAQSKKRRLRAACGLTLDAGAFRTDPERIPQVIVQNVFLVQRRGFRASLAGQF
jgi:hypothetical protein